MPSDDIRDLLGRYATTTLSDDERQRLFDAALTDQDLFEELAREQELKMLLQQPGAHARMLRALEPRRKTAWIVSGALAAAFSIVLMVVLMRPKQQPVQQVAVATTPAAPVEIARPEPLTPPPPPTVKAKKTPPVGQPVIDAPAKDVAKQEAVEVHSSAPAVQPRPMSAFAPRASPLAGARDQAVSGTTSLFGFHYSVETPGHLIIIPGADGYLLVKNPGGTILFNLRQIAAAIKTDIAIPEGVDSVIVTFSETAVPVERTPTIHSEPSGSIEGTGGLAVEIKVK
jgi:hypothetical protein